MQATEQAGLPISPDEAAERAFARDRWLWLKLPVGLYLLWSFFLPQLWKLILLLVAGIRCAYIVPCSVGEGVSDFHLWFSLVTMALVFYGVAWYSIYFAGFLSSPGWLAKTLAAGLILLFPFLVILLGVLTMLLGDLFRVPQEAIWAYLDRHALLGSWKIVR